MWCHECHANGSTHPAIVAQNHANFFPIGATASHALGKTISLASGASVTVACTTCHQDPVNRASVTCTSCHTADGINAKGPAPVDLSPAHAASLAGGEWRAGAGPTPQCMLCHAGDFTERVAVHGAGGPAFTSDAPGTTFTIDATSPGHFVACETCHTSTIASDANLKNPRIDFS